MAITSTAIAIYFVEFTKSSLTAGKEYTLVETKPAEKTPEGGKPVSDSPKTGDNTNLWLWFIHIRLPFHCSLSHTIDSDVSMDISGFIYYLFSVFSLCSSRR